MPLNIGCDGMDYSLFNPTQFRLSFDKIPNFEFWCQSVQPPTVSMQPAHQTTREVDIKLPGDKIMFSQFTATVYLDKHLRTYKEISNWIKDLSVYGGAIGKRSDASLLLNDVEIRFNDMFPVQITPFDMSIAVSDTTPVTFSVVFEYTTFQIL